MPNLKKYVKKLSQIIAGKSSLRGRRKADGVTRPQGNVAIADGLNFEFKSKKLFRKIYGKMNETFG